MNTSQILRESELDLQSQDSWLGYHPWNTRHCALRYDCFQIKESSSDSDASAETFMLSTISDVTGVPDEPARFRVILGEARTLELRSEAGGSNAADDARAWVQAINMQRRLVSTAKADAQRSLRAAQQQQAAAVASGSGRANTIEAAGNAYSRRQMAASSSAAARDSFGHQQQQLQQQQDDPKGALTRAIRAAAEANEVGAQTVQQLARQEEQLDRMQDDLDETDDTLSRTQWMLKGMKSIGGAVSNFFSSGPTLDKHDRSAPSSSAQSVAAAAVARAQALPSAGGGSASSGGAGLSAAEQAKRRQEKELDEEHGAELDQLSGMLKNMHGLAETMGTQLQTQNHKLDRLGNSVDSVSNKLQNQNSTMRKILRD